MSGVSRLLVTGDENRRIDLWAVTAMYANWIEGQENAHGTATYLVTVFAEYRDSFLDAARQIGVTVEEIENADDAETHRLLVGEPASGWVPPHGKAAER